MYGRSHYARVRYARAEVTAPVDITIDGSPAVGDGFAPNGTTPLAITIEGASAFGHAFAPSAEFQIIVPGGMAFGHGYAPHGDAAFSGADLVIVGSAAYGHGFSPSGVTQADLRIGAWVLDMSQSWGFGLDADMDVSAEVDPATITDGAQIQRVSETYPTPTLSNGRPT